MTDRSATRESTTAPLAALLDETHRQHLELCDAIEAATPPAQETAAHHRQHPRRRGPAS